MFFSHRFFRLFYVFMFACLHVHAPPQDSFLKVPPSGGTLCQSQAHIPLNPPPPPLSTPSPKQPAPDKETNKSQLNTGGHSTTLQILFFLFWRTILSELNRCCLMAGCLGRQVSPSCPTGGGGEDAQAPKGSKRAGWGLKNKNL